MRSTPDTTAPNASQTTPVRAARPTLAVSITGSESRIVDALWQALDEQTGEKSKFSLVRVEAGLGDAAICIIRSQDLADPALALSDLDQDSARLKIAVEAGSGVDSDPGLKQRLDERLASASGQPSPVVIRLPDRQKLLKKSAGGGVDEHLVLQLQAKALAKLLKSAAMGSAPASADDVDAPRKNKRSGRQTREKTKKVPNEKRAKTGDGSRSGTSERKTSGRDAKKDGRVTIALVGLVPTLTDDLHLAIKKELAGAGIAFAIASGRSKADMIVVAPTADAGSDDLAQQVSEIPAHRHSVTAFIETRAGDGRAISDMARDRGGAILDLDTGFEQLGYTRMLRPNGELNPARLERIAAALRNLAVAKGIGSGLSPRFPSERPPDFLHAVASAKIPGELLETLSWDEKTLPRNLRSKFDLDKIEAFAASKLIRPRSRKLRSENLSAEDAPGELSLGPEIDWSMDLPDDNARESLLGLDFLSPALTYWFMRANGSKAEEVAEVDRRLKERGVTASFMLNRAGEIISSFQQRRSEPAFAWKDSVAWSRTRTLLLFLLCTKIAAKRRINFDETRCAPAFQALLEAFEWLRHEDYRQVGSLEAIEQDMLLIAAALPLRSLPYGRRLIEQTLRDLERNQLDQGLRDDGVWKGSFQDHCSVLSSLANTLRALRDHKLPGGDRLADAIRKMGPFAAGMLKPDGRPMTIDQIPPKSQARMLAVARGALRSGEADKKADNPARETSDKPRSGGTHVYPQAGYLISHSGKVAGHKASQLVFHAFAGSVAREELGAISLAFAAGSVDLVVGGGAATRKSSEEVRKASHQDPAARNGFRVNGAGYDIAQSASPNAISFAGHWAAPDWAAARAVNAAYQGAVVARTAIHLKKYCALIVIDELRAKAANPAEFEQFWHLGPQFTAHSAGGPLLHFTSDAPGVLNVALDRDGSSGPTIDRGGPSNPLGWTAIASSEVVSNFYLCRRKKSAHAVMATLFHFASGPVPISIEIGAEGIGAWGIQVQGPDFDARFTLKRDGVFPRS